MPNAENFYLTSPIFYVNDAPHIGHAYTEVACDVLARWHRMRGDNTWFLTGTDEHGQKILRTATAAGVQPKEWADKLVRESWQPLLHDVNISNDDFIRTTDKRHETGVAAFLTKLYETGHIYAGEFEALYCVGCEEFKPKTEIVEGEGAYNGEKVCSIHSKPLELLQEKNYFFKMSAFRERLLEHYEKNPDFVRPASARNEVISFVTQGLEDLSISRTSFDWGVPIPWDSTHVTYVWFDALLNYVTALGYPQALNQNDDLPRWPGYHLVGKDILRFHAVIWPAMLMAAGLPVPRGVFAHGWLLVGGEKMSKSKLTGIAPREITDTFGADAFRYYFLRAISFGQDGSFSWEDLDARYNAELANGFGNLASRTLAMIKKYFSGRVPAPGEQTDAETHIAQLCGQAAAHADTHIANFEIHEAIASVWRIVDELNGYITVQQPWRLAKDETLRERLGTVLYTCAEGLRVLAVLLSAVIPEASEKLWAALGLQGELGSLKAQRFASVTVWGATPEGVAQGQLQPLFPRVEEKD